MAAGDPSAVDEDAPQLNAALEEVTDGPAPVQEKAKKKKKKKKKKAPVTNAGAADADPDAGLLDPSSED